MSNLKIYHPFGRLLQAFDADGIYSPSSAGFRVDIRDEGNKYLLSADLPGVKKEDVQVSVEDNVLSISAKFGATDNGKALHQERVNGSCARSFRLSEHLDADSIEAEMKDGVLALSLPKAANAARRDIQIR
ncbi:MAG: Hsp20/alpha crystallin family protein [Gammaproteobacteria bacterium]